MSRSVRVGWVIGDQLARMPWVREQILAGGGVGLARYLWLARQARGPWRAGMDHEIYRPWRRYDAVVFLKSMDARAQELLGRLIKRGVPCVFDCNVNYFELGGTEYYRGMLPSARQRCDAISMTRAASAVIGDSEYITGICARYNPCARWVTDGVRLDVVPEYRPWRPGRSPLRLLWCGEAVKLFELLAVEGILRRYAPHIELILITNDLKALNRWYPEIRTRFESLMQDVPHRFVPYESIESLFELYAQGGVFLSPRFLDNPYNMGHTEWKVALAAANGRIVLCSPVPSYVRLAERAQGQGIRICRDAHQWAEALDAVLAGGWDFEEEEAAARAVIERYYSTEAVSPQYHEVLRAVIGRQLLQPVPC